MTRIALLAWLCLPRLRLASLHRLHGHHQPASLIWPLKSKWPHDLKPKLMDKSIRVEKCICIVLTNRLGEYKDSAIRMGRGTHENGQGLGDSYSVVTWSLNNVSSHLESQLHINYLEWLVYITLRLASLKLCVLNSWWIYWSWWGSSTLNIDQP